MLIPTFNGKNIEVTLPEQLKGINLIAIPALIDPHVHFRTPGSEQKENWETGSQAAIAGGVTTVFDMPNNNPSIINAATLEHKKKIIDEQLEKVKIPLNYHLYLGATKDNLAEIEKNRNKIIGVKMFMGASTGNLLIDKQEDQEKIFKKCAELDLVLAVHAEDNSTIYNLQSELKNPTISDHSKIRSREAAITAVKTALGMAQKYGTKLYICHVSTKEELDLIKKAKQSGIKVFAEVTPHHLYLSQNDYNHLGTLVQMNPPIRTTADNEALWQGILEGTIDTIGTDHAPHTLEEKAQNYPISPSGVPGIETFLPLLLNAYNEGKITLEKIIELSRTNIERIFNLPINNDWTIIDLDLEKEVKNKNLKTKCGWSPFNGWKLRGWPVATILNNKIYLIN